MKKKIAFIINPISGGVNKKNIPGVIQQYIDHTLFETEILFTKKAEDTQLLSAQAVKDKYDIVVAVGGDGTINQVARALVNTESAMGIIALGSGNGFARYLRIPMDPVKGIHVLNTGVTKTIDSCTINNERFVNVSGVGFDAHVAWKFSTAPKRGFWSYTKVTLNEFSNYALRKYQLEIDGQTMEREAFLICFSNGDQYGNNAYIAPGADMQDGLLDIAIIKRVTFASMPRLAWEMFTERFNRSKDVEILRGKKIIVRRQQNEVVNIDGEPFHMEQDLNIHVVPRSLKVIVSAS